MLVPRRISWLGCALGTVAPTQAQRNPQAGIPLPKHLVVHHSPPPRAGPKTLVRYLLVHRLVAPVVDEESAAGSREAHKAVGVAVSGGELFRGGKGGASWGEGGEGGERKREGGRVAAGGSQVGRIVVGSWGGKRGGGGER